VPLPAETDFEAGSVRGWIAWGPVAAMLLCAAGLRNLLHPWEWMWALAFALYAGLKWVTWWRARGSVSHPAWRSAAYLFAWPGMDAESFLDPMRRAARPSFAEWLLGILRTASGATIIWVVVRAVPAGRPLLRGWTGMVGLALLLHFGIFHLASLFWRRVGIEARPIMAEPLRSVSLSEFWGKRWNLGFRQLAHEFVFRPLHKRFGSGGASLAVFLVSGLIHELVISVPARAGYGLPTAYFVLQGLGVAFERSSAVDWMGLRKRARGWIFTAIVTTGPAYWLFHPPFVLRVILPFLKAVRAL
jgi:hypothetical protein